MDGVEVEGFVDVLVLAARRLGLRLAAGRAVVARVVQGVEDLAIVLAAPRHERVLLYGVEIFCGGTHTQTQRQTDKRKEQRQREIEIVCENK